MSSLFTRTRTVIKRDIKEVEPKLAVGLLSGSLTGAALTFVEAPPLDWHLPITAQYAIVIIGFFVGGWIKSSTFPTVQQIESDLPQAIELAQEVVKHPVTLKTGALTVIPTPADPSSVSATQPGKFDNILNQFPSAGGNLAASIPADLAATQKLN